MLHVRKRLALPALLISSALAASCKTEQPITQSDKSGPAEEAASQPVDEPKPATPMDEPAAAAPANSLGDDTNCKVEPAWIKGPSLPNGAAFKSENNCRFHQWAYQTFLWLVSEDPKGKDGALVFEGFANPKDLFKPGGPSGAYPGRAATAPPEMLARMAKSQTTADIDSVFQAGPGNKALIDQAGNIVYYSNHLNDKYWEFVVEHKLYDLEALNKFDPARSFPVDALELKAAWRIVQIGDGKPIIPDAEKSYYVIEAEVPAVAPDAKGILQENPKKRFKAKLALVGMHVVGVVEGHPEFIWATFEHVNNAPNCADIPAKEGGPWNFYDGKATTATANQFDVGDPMAVVNVCLTHPLGGGDDGNKKAIDTLNENVHAGIEELKGKDSIWLKYFLGGAVWTSGTIPVNNGAFPPPPAGNEKDKPTQLGSLDLANTTMETFTQDDNCFACHNAGAHEIVVGKKSTEVNAKYINLSHFVVNYQAAQQVKGK